LSGARGGTLSGARGGALSRALAGAHGGSELLPYSYGALPPSSANLAAEVYDPVAEGQMKNGTWDALVCSPSASLRWHRTCSSAFAGTCPCCRTTSRWACRV